MEGIGPDGWRIAPDATRRALFDALAGDPKAAARGGGKVWPALDDESRAIIARSAAQDADAAADLIERIGGGGFDRLAPSARRGALKAALRSPKQARRVAAAIWDRMDAAERAAAARSVARDPDELAAWLDHAGAAAWEALAPQGRAAALERMAHAPDAAARLGVALWDALDDDARALVARSAARDPQAAARLAAGVGARLDDDRIAALVRATLGGANATRLAAQALADGLPWRDWMAHFLPTADDAADVWDAWRAVIRRLPPHVAARLIPPRRTSR